MPDVGFFAQEYLADLNAFRAAAACGIEFKFEGEGFYVYFLIDQRSGSIFYVGKGKGQRLREHRRSARNLSGVNQIKAARIMECGDHLAEVVFADNLDEVTAFRIEKDLIAALKHVGLTNIARGSVHPLQSLLASVDRGMSLIRSYDEWVTYASSEQLDAAVKLSGSTEAFYRQFWVMYEELRHEVQLKLNSISGNSNVTARR
jgi:hypothetical protein